MKHKTDERTATEEERFNAAVDARIEKDKNSPAAQIGAAIVVLCVAFYVVAQII